MYRHLLRKAIPIVAVLFLAGPAAAQNPYPPTAYGPRVYNPRSQTISPYLNLFSGTGRPGVNYYNFVRPYTQSPQPVYNGGGQAYPVDPYGQLADVNTDWSLPKPRPTGNVNGPAAAFNSYGGYFNSTGTIGAPAFRGQQSMGGRAPAPTVSPRR
jgi:hypothetical protein